MSISIKRMRRRADTTEVISMVVDAKQSRGPSADPGSYVWRPGRGWLFPGLAASLWAIVAVLWRLDPAVVVVCGCLAFGIVVLAQRRLLRCVDRDFSRPLCDVVTVVDRMRSDGAAARHIPDAGAQIVRNLSRRLNQSLSAAIENSQLSQAKLLSVEAAFDRIHAVLRTLAEAVFVVRDRGEVVLANPAARALMGAGSAVDRQPVQAVLDGALGRRVAEALAAVGSGGECREVCRGVQHDSRVFDIEVTPIESRADDSGFGTLIVIADVTTSHEVARLKDEFLSSVSHELRTPLTNIVAYAEILTQMTQQDVESREFLGIIQSESKRLHRLVDNVLEYSRLESGQAVWEIEDVSLGDVLESCVSVFEDRALQQGVKIEVVGGVGADVRADRTYIQSVFANVLDNALKFTPEGGAVRMETDVVDACVITRIHDSGPGVPPESRVAIFERLTQLGDTLVDKPAGTGMGLAVSRAILERIDGSIRCQESPLGGACFVVEIPTAATLAGSSPA